jgi:hypothetical protein
VSRLVRIVAAWVLAPLMLLWGAAAEAGWSLSLDAESFKWQEQTNPAVTEKGPRFGFSWEYEQLRPQGWQFAYRGQFRRGTVDYNGSFLFGGGPATARTEYTGVVNEEQGIYRFAGGMELLGGLGLDYWQRNILPDQKEDYLVLFLRLGMNFDRRLSNGWFGGGGVKYPFHVSENGHLDEVGFDQNPRLSPKGEASLYGQVGYRFTPQWSLIGYYDSYRFGESDAVLASSGAPTFLVFQPASRVDALGVRLRYSFP